MKRNLFVLCLLVGLTACGSTPSKQEPVAPAPTAIQPAPQPVADGARPTVQAKANTQAVMSATVLPQAEANARQAAQSQETAELPPATAAAVAAAPGETQRAAAEDLPISTRSVFFPFDVDAVQSSDLETIQAHGAYLADHPEITVRVEGHADERGSSEYNLALGQRRANNTRKALVLAGARASQIETVSYGEEKPKALGHDEAAWAQNRRADIVYVK